MYILMQPIEEQSVIERKLFRYISRVSFHCFSTRMFKSLPNKQMVWKNFNIKWCSSVDLKSRLVSKCILQYCDKQYWKVDLIFLFYSKQYWNMETIIFLFYDRQYWNVVHYISVLGQTILERGPCISVLRQRVLECGGIYYFNNKQYWKKAICYNKLFLHMDIISALQ